MSVDHSERQVKVGDTVIYRYLGLGSKVKERTATVIDVLEPGNPKSALNLTVFEPGETTSNKGVQSAAEEGEQGWHWPT